MQRLCFVPQMGSNWGYIECFRRRLVKNVLKTFQMNEPDQQQIEHALIYMFQILDLI